MDTFATTELGLASMLFASGLKYHGLRETSSWRMEMIFDEPDEELLRSWRAGTAVGNLLVYWRAGNTLKSDLKNRERTGA